MEGKRNPELIRLRILIFSSLLLNLLFVSYFLAVRRKNSGWTSPAAAAAEAAAAVSCSGHGRVYVDSVVVDGEKACECNTCYAGKYCSELSPECPANADSGDPLFLEPYWQRNPAGAAILISGWHRMGYHAYGNGSISPDLERHIRLLHNAVNNAVTDGRYIVFGVGSTQLFNSIVHALSPNATLSPSSIVATVPYYDAYRRQTVFFDSREYEWEGDTADWVNSSSSSSSSKVVEFVTSPNNPDGKLMKSVIEGSTVICDRAYYWPHYTAIPAPADEDIMTFTLSKVSGHAGSRFGWALVKNREVYQKMLQYLTLNIMLISTDTQLRTLHILKAILSKLETQENIFKYSYETLSERWSKLSNVMSRSNRFSLQELSPQYCNYFHKIRDPSPAYAWVKCGREEDWDCQAVMREAGIISRSGAVFGTETRYTRLSLMKTKDDFDQLLIKIEALVSREGLDSW